MRRATPCPDAEPSPCPRSPATNSTPRCAGRAAQIFPPYKASRCDSDLSSLLPTFLPCTSQSEAAVPLGRKTASAPLETRAKKEPAVYPYTAGIAFLVTPNLR